MAVNNLRSIPRLSFFVLILIILGCTDARLEEPGVASSNERQNQQSSSLPDEPEFNGEIIFKEKCIGCHRSSDANIVRNLSVDELTEVISKSMPIDAPETCMDSCALAVTNYITSINPYFGIAETETQGVIPTPLSTIDKAPVAIHRLNRSEYNNSIRDLFQTELRPADSFPEDNFGYGFNNIAKVLSTSLAHVEQYMSAAERIAREVVRKEVVQNHKEWELKYWDNSQVEILSKGALLYSTGSSVFSPISFNNTSLYNFKISAGQMAAGPDLAQLGFYIDGELIDIVEVDTSQHDPHIFNIYAEVTEGIHDIKISFLNDFRTIEDGDRNLFVDWFSIESLMDRGSTVIKCDPSNGIDCAAETIELFGRKVWRRPLSHEEKESMINIFSETNDFRTGIAQVIKTFLMSPNFLYRPEFDSDLYDSSALKLDSFELASRLSFFIWSSTPDDKLLSHAMDGSILEESTLISETRRLMSDPRAESLIENFAVQWLKFDLISEQNPSKMLFPTFSDSLIESARTETRLFLNDLFLNNRPITALLTADYSFINEELSNHYDIPNFANDGFIKVNMKNTGRRGILGHSSILTATSHPSNTSPVKRGMWVLENLLCQEPPPPPPGVENLAEDQDEAGDTTRERFERHRDSSSICYSCHAMMDPIGFGLENYDAIGRWRTEENGIFIDSSGNLPEGDYFSGPLELTTILANSPHFPLCATEHLLTYALGRGIEGLRDGSQGSDYPALFEIYKVTEERGHRIGDIVEAIVLSPVFRERRGAESKRLKQ